MATAIDEFTCPLCSGRMAHPLQYRGDRARVNCNNCGDHFLSSSAHARLLTPPDQAERARMTHGVAKLPAGDVVTFALLQAFSEMPLPQALEQVDNLVLYMARRLQPGESADLDVSTLRASVGTVTEMQVEWVIHQAVGRRYFSSSTKQSQILGRPAHWDDAALSLDGWDRHAALLRDGAGSRHAFMAMKFGDAQMDGIYADHMRLAVDQAGFELRTTAGDHKTAGSIDNRMRVEIRTSRFVVCDLTHGNRGAYWEAGFAEGLGRPVFYTCRQDVLSDKTHPDHPHFDTAHQLIVAWDPDDVAAGMQELKDVIRATLPAEARMEDPTNG